MASTEHRWDVVKLQIHKSADDKSAATVWCYALSYDNGPKSQKNINTVSKLCNEELGKF